MLCFYGNNAFGLNSFITLMDSPALLSAGGGFETFSTSGKTQSRQHPLGEYLPFVPTYAGQALPMHSCLDPQPGLYGSFSPASSSDSFPISCLLPAVVPSPSVFFKKTSCFTIRPPPVPLSSHLSLASEPHPLAFPSHQHLYLLLLLFCPSVVSP